MNRIPAWLSYSLLRLLLFFAPLALMLALGTWWWLAAILAAALSFALSLVLLRKPREQAALALFEAAERRKSHVKLDELIEDAHAETLEREQNS